MTLIETLINADTAGKKAAATKKLNKFVEEQAAKGKDPKWVRAGVKARITRIKNGNA